jgi:hypothetical protein
LPCKGIRGEQLSFDIAASAKQSSPRHLKFTKAHSDPRFACGVQSPYLNDFITKLCSQQAAVILNHENVNNRSIGQGEAQHKKNKRLKLGGGHAYDQSNV